MQIVDNFFIMFKIFSNTCDLENRCARTQKTPADNVLSKDLF